jgi:hypothetical protein
MIGSGHEVIGLGLKSSFLHYLQNIYILYTLWYDKFTWHTRA